MPEHVEVIIIIIVFCGLYLILFYALLVNILNLVA